MVKRWFDNTESGRILPGEVLEELRRLLFATVIPQIIIGCAAVVFSVILYGETRDVFYVALAAIAGLTGSVRVVSVLAHRHRPNLLSIASWEAVYALATTAFSAALAAFAFRAISADAPSGGTLATILVISYCAGVVARMAVRPTFATANVILTAAPLAFAFALRADPTSIAVSGVLFAIIYGSLSTVRHTYEITVDHLLTRHEMRERAGLDDLTNLPNRAHLVQRLDSIFAETRRTSLAIHFIDIDHFKAINDGFGHSLGDQILQEIARRIQSCQSGATFAARIGGDEFVVVQPDSDEKQARRLAECIVEAVARPFSIGTTLCRVGTSCGCHLVAPGVTDWRSALAAADEALYEAKRAGRGRVVYSAGQSAVRTSTAIAPSKGSDLRFCADL